jgi:hypothetical protein
MRKPEWWMFGGGIVVVLMTRGSAVGLLLGIPLLAASLPLVFKSQEFAGAVIRRLGQDEGTEVEPAASQGYLREIWGRVQQWGRSTGDVGTEAAVLLGFGALAVLTAIVLVISAVFVILLAILFLILLAAANSSSGNQSGSEGQQEENRGGGAHHLAFEGMSRSGYPLLTMGDRGRVFEGSSISGSPLYTVVGNHLFQGAAVSGSPLATRSGGRIFDGLAVSGSPLATLSGNHAFGGQAPSGSPLVTVPSGDRGTLFAAAYHVIRGS